LHGAPIVPGRLSREGFGKKVIAALAGIVGRVKTKTLVAMTHGAARRQTVATGHRRTSEMRALGEFTGKIGTGMGDHVAVASRTDQMIRCRARQGTEPAVRAATAMAGFTATITASR